MVPDLVIGIIRPTLRKTCDKNLGREPLSIPTLSCFTEPMRGHGLMQAIARVNRVFRDKPGGLVVDYLGLADELAFARIDGVKGLHDRARQ